MQNRYFGDVGDFGKFALLKYIFSNEPRSNIRLGLVWCLFPNEGHNNDGRHVSYLTREDMKELDPELFMFLRRCIENNLRRVSEFEQSGLLPPDTIFFRNFVSEGGMADQRVTHRIAWFEQCLRATTDCDVVFLDPDNGVEVASISKRHPKAGKYMFWDEICAFLERGKSLIIYHHLNRTASVAEQIRGVAEKFSEVSSAEFRMVKLVFRRGSCRSYWLLLRNDIADFIEPKIDEMLDAGWRGHFEMV